MEYERLTDRDVTKVCFDTWELCGLDDVCKRDCRKPEPCKIPQMIQRLAKLEDKIEAGTLVELPCKEGDIVYFVNWYRPIPRIEAFKVDHLEVNKNYIYVACYDFENEYNYSMYRMNSKDISFTKAEAEKRVEEIRNETKSIHNSEK